MLSKSKLQGLLALPFLSFILAACQPAEFNSQNYRTNEPGTTGLLNERGIPYTIGGDKRVSQAQGPASPKDPQNPTPEEKQNLDLAKAIRKIQMTRTSEDGKNSRFGTSKVAVKIQVETLPGLVETLEFETKPDQKPGEIRFTNVKAKSSSNGNLFYLSGSFADSEDEDQSRGVLDLVQQKQSNSSARIFVRSYLANLNLRKDQKKIQSSQLNQTLEDLQKDTFAWVTNWAIVLGPSYYDVQILKLKVAKSPSDLHKNISIADTAREDRGESKSETVFTFSGEALRTGDAPSHPTELKAGRISPSSVQLRGDAEESDRRVYTLRLKDPKSGEQAEALLDVSRATKSKPLSPRLEPKIQSELPGSFFPLNLNGQALPRTAKMLADFNNNIDLEEVQGWIKYWTGQSAKPPRAQALNGSSIQKHFEFMNPVKNLTAAIFGSFDILPHASLVTIFESSYFRSGNYKIEVNGKSTAAGPFQIIKGTALNLGLRVDSSQKIGARPSALDERLYFASAACGAANLFSKEAALFPHDLTLVLLSYYQGGPTASNLVACNTQSGSKAGTCKKIAGERKENEQEIEDARRFKITFEEFARLRMGKSDLITYVSRVLAAYFISVAPSEFGFEIPDGPKTLPTNLLPPNPIKNQNCRDAVDQYLKSRSGLDRA